ncbi:MAG: Coenzyme F420 hydrogenase/dehydrogenase, beta subunit C-terminal domain [Candidatus Sabulitectum sp.]|nr:Coenzyme F420 hydrogenase/dehydrogenase, beta subunit C-terminal domain [Candidatus Sabulitectum sp.]
MKENEIRSFDDLYKDVIDTGICSKCGGCVSVCSANMIGALKLDENGFPTYTDKELCLACGLCYMICPHTHTVREEVKSRFDWKAPIGHYDDVISARATDPDVVEVATDGGVVTSLLIHMLEAGHIDGAVVSTSLDGYTRQAIVATSREEILQAAGSHFGELPHLEEVGEKYANYVSVVKFTCKDNPQKLKKLAVVGTPCQITSIRNMQALAIVPSDIITFTIGLFCMQCFEMGNLMDKEFIKSRRIDPGEIATMNIKEDFILTLKSGLKVHIPMKEIEEIARPACLKCNYFANDYADISVGGLGSPEKHTTVMIRTIRGRLMMADALAKKSIKLRESRTADEHRVYRHGMISLIEEYAARKVDRARKYADTDGSR